MDVFFVGNVRLVEAVGVDGFFLVAGAEELDEGGLEHLGLIVDGVFDVADVLDAADVRLGEAVLLEGVGVAALLFARRAVPS